MHGTGYADRLLPDEEVARIVRETHADGDVVGKRVLVVVCGPVFPHEVVGFSRGQQVLLPPSQWERS